MVKLDLKDAYLSVSLHQDHRRFMTFHWNNRLWRFNTLPFGLSNTPYAFTMLIKPVVALLRKLGIRAILYLDDMLIIAQKKEELIDGALGHSAERSYSIYRLCDQHQEECDNNHNTITGDGVPI